MAVDEDVGARLSGQASRSTEVSSVTSLKRESVESEFPVRAMSLTSKRLMNGSRSSSSRVSPEYERASTASPSESRPRSPCSAFCESSTTAVAPVELNVAAIL